MTPRKQGSMSENATSTHADRGRQLMFGWINRCVLSSSYGPGMGSLENTTRKKAW